MRGSRFALCLLASFVASPVLASTLSREDAMARVHSAGYPLVSRTDPAPGVWDVWASRDGIVYKVEVSATDGTLIAATPVENDD